jgi:hypothetical protein
MPTHPGPRPDGHRRTLTVKAAGGVMHDFVVGRVFEEENVDFLKEILSEGHQLGNHTYDHVDILATRPEDIQFRFRRAPWLIYGKEPREVIIENIRMTERAMKTRLGIYPKASAHQEDFVLALTTVRTFN